MNGTTTHENGTSNGTTSPKRAREELIAEKEAELAIERREHAKVVAKQDSDARVREAWIAKRNVLRERSHAESHADNVALRGANSFCDEYSRQTLGELALVIYGQNYDGNVALCALDDAAAELSLLGMLIPGARSDFDLDDLGNRLWRLSERCKVALELHSRMDDEESPEVGSLRARNAELQAEVARNATLIGTLTRACTNFEARILGGEILRKCLEEKLTKAKARAKRASRKAGAK
jgi:hypothetical protein